MPAEAPDFLLSNRTVVITGGGGILGIEPNMHIVQATLIESCFMTRALHAGWWSRLA